MHEERRSPARATDGRRPRRRFAPTGLIALVVVTALFAGSCGSSSSTGSATNNTSAPIQDEGTPVDGGSAVIGVPAETPGWNSHDSQWPGWSTLVASSVLEPLLTIDKALNP